MELGFGVGKGGGRLNPSIEGSKITITGGTGSFGATMARHLLGRGVAEVRVFSRDEAKQDAMRHELKDERLRFFIGDTRDSTSLKSAIQGSDHVFHAAALKQVPSAEFFPMEAVKTNILGSANVVELAVKLGVQSVVCLSTDKAVYPINAMGMTKAVMEKTAIAIARANQDSATKISVTRYGNVMYSRGSVIPLFVRQIKAGSPVTVTDPEMTRFLMSLKESVDLVEYAFTHGESGGLYVRKAPAATVGVLAQAVAELFGKPDAKIRNIGVRHGEKLFESLLGAEERNRAKDMGDYFNVPMDARDLNYELFYEKGDTDTKEFESYTSHNTLRLSVEDVKRKLLELPEIQHELGMSD